jgi:hypothetical protein
MGFLSPPKMPAPPPPPPTPEPAPAYEDEARRAKVKADQAALRRRQVGAKETILTSYQGLDNSTLNTDKKTLLG